MERESTNSQVAFENYGLVADVMLSLFMKSHSHQLGIDGIDKREDKDTQIAICECSGATPMYVCIYVCDTMYY